MLYSLMDRVPSQRNNWKMRDSWGFVSPEPRLMKSILNWRKECSKSGAQPRLSAQTISFPTNRLESELPGCDPGLHTSL